MLVSAALLVACAPEISIEEREPWRPPARIQERTARPIYPATIATVDVRLPALPMAGSGVALGARSVVRLDRGTITSATIASGGSVFVEDKVRAGRIVAAGDILVRWDSHLGDLEAGGSTWLGSGSTATSRQPHARLVGQSLVHELIEVPDAYEDIVEKAGTHTVLLPGSYGVVTLAPSSRTTLLPGTYFVRKLRASPGSTVVVSGGSPVLVYVIDALRLAAGIDDGGDATRLCVFFSGTSAVELASFRGTLVASNARIEATGAFVGFLYGDTIDSSPAARFEAIPSPLVRVAPPLTAQSVPLNVVQDTAFTHAVATFTDPNTSDTASAFSATVDWGDGNVSLGTITGADGAFTVTGTHTYPRTDADQVRVTVVDRVTGVTASAVTAAPDLTVYGNASRPRPAAGAWFEPPLSNRP